MWWLGMSYADEQGDIRFLPLASFSPLIEDCSYLRPFDLLPLVLSDEPREVERSVVYV